MEDTATYTETEKLDWIERIAKRPVGVTVAQVLSFAGRNSGSPNPSSVYAWAREIFGCTPSAISLAQIDEARARLAEGNLLVRRRRRRYRSVMERYDALLQAVRRPAGVTLADWSAADPSRPCSTSLSRWGQDLFGKVVSELTPREVAAARDHALGVDGDSSGGQPPPLLRGRPKGVALADASGGPASLSDAQPPIAVLASALAQLQSTVEEALRGTASKTEPATVKKVVEVELDQETWNLLDRLDLWTANTTLGIISAAVSEEVRRLAAHYEARHGRPLPELSSGQKPAATGRGGKP